ncbi:MAG: PfkB family carbohydrate kinase [Victivallaceae bacterium]|nr:PfkB family carbohydrate kinase [Victivallaceae bacterium]
MNRNEIKNILQKFQQRRIAVLGDLMLDVYVWGEASRISPEAPVPVVRIKRKSCCLGGAANVMRNVATLGGQVEAFGVIGEDSNGKKIRELFKQYNISDCHICVDDQRCTTEKQRVVAGAQQLLRVDYEDTDPTEQDMRDCIVHDIVSMIKANRLDAVIIEDYGKGLLDEKMLQQICDAANAAGVITAFDPKPGHLMHVTGLSVIKPNRKEAFEMAALFDKGPVEDANDDEPLKNAAAKLLEQWQPEYLIISLAAQGLALFKRDGSMKVIPTRAREVFDVSGAGDTVIAAFTLALSAGAPAEIAAEVANHAAGIVVGKVGTVTVTADELLGSFS